MRPGRSSGSWPFIPTASLNHPTKWWSYWPPLPVLRLRKTVDLAVFEANYSTGGAADLHGLPIWSLLRDPASNQIVAWSLSGENEFVKRK